MKFCLVAKISLSQYFNKPIRNSFQFYNLDQRLLCLALDDK